MSKCKVCGCTDIQACPGGCWWVTKDEDICSKCAIGKVFQSNDRKLKYKLLEFFHDKDDKNYFKARILNVTGPCQWKTMIMAAAFRVKMKWVERPTMIELHGEVVGHRHEPYHDVTTYEDGYEEWFSIGD